MAGVGWIRIHRQIVDSDIYQMPPLYLRVFERLLIEANHQDSEIPYKEKGEKVIGKKLIKRGERLTSVRDICKWVSWYERGKEIIPNPKTIQNILDWLAENDMIQIYGSKGNRTETHYNIVNYNNFQEDCTGKVTKKKQFGNSLETVWKQSLDTNNNDKEYIKNDKECKEDISIGDDGEKKSNKKSAPKKDIYGEFEKVSLTIDEFNKLNNGLGEVRVKEMIVRLDAYKASTGKRYSSDYATILNWQRKDIAEGKYREQNGTKKTKETSGNIFLDMMYEEMEKEAWNNDQN